MRLFIAINFNDATASSLIALRDALQSRAAYGRFSALENLHLTLVFLGESDMKQTAAAKTAMDAIKFEPFTITIDRIGRFRRSGGDVWWAGVRENKALSNLHGDLTDKLIAVGFELEKRRYSPHITLGREIVTNEPPREIEPFTGAVSAFELMKSAHIRGKLTYTTIHKRTIQTDRALLFSEGKRVGKAT